jgi:hypothetical protein
MYMLVTYTSIYNMYKAYVSPGWTQQIVLSQSYFTTDDQSVSKSWFQGPCGSHDRIFISVDIYEYCFIDMSRGVWLATVVNTCHNIFSSTSIIRTFTNLDNGPLPISEVSLYFHLVLPRSCLTNRGHGHYLHYPFQFILHNHMTDSGAHPAFNPMGTRGSFPGG